VGEVGEGTSASGILQEGTRERYPLGLIRGAGDGNGVTTTNNDQSIRERMYVNISFFTSSWLHIRVKDDKYFF
jgi:hypothetical protein